MCKQFGRCIVLAYDFRLSHTTTSVKITPLTSIPSFIPIKSISVITNYSRCLVGPYVQFCVLYLFRKAIVSSYRVLPVVWGSFYSENVDDSKRQDIPGVLGRNEMLMVLAVLPKLTSFLGQSVGNFSRDSKIMLLSTVQWVQLKSHAFSPSL